MLVAGAEGRCGRQIGGEWFARRSWHTARLSSRSRPLHRLQFHQSARERQLRQGAFRRFATDSPAFVPAFDYRLTERTFMRSAIKTAKRMMMVNVLL